MDFPRTSRWELINLGWPRLGLGASAYGGPTSAPRRGKVIFLTKIGFLTVVSLPPSPTPCHHLGASGSEGAPGFCHCLGSGEQGEGLLLPACLAGDLP